MNEDAHIKGPLVSTKNDPRVTKIGKFIRYTNFNELPQLINVVKREMSIVGPRPEVPEYVRLWPKYIKDKIFSVKPGVTGVGTIYFSNEGEILEEADCPETHYVQEILPKKLEMEIQYIENYSFLEDLDIIAKTLFIHGIRPWIEKIFGIQKRH
jgi:lipopolysaccharide/colanic/teichoic acid biosynthesis glycosyltransferase